MLGEHVHYAQSTDQLGYFGQDATSLAKVTPDNFPGEKYVEVVATRPIRTLRKYINSLDDRGFHVTHLHGHTGQNGAETPFDSLKLNIIRLLTPTTKELLTHFPDKAILIHSPEARKPDVVQAIIKAKPQFIWIENHLGKEELEKSLASVDMLARHGIEAGVMFDVMHYLVGGEQIPFAQKWQEMIDHLWALAPKNPKIRGIHLCIGTTYDKLPLEELTDKNLENLAQVLRLFPLKIVVFENQQHGVSGLLGAGVLQAEKLKKRTEGILSRLQAVGLQ